MSKILWIDDEIDLLQPYIIYLKGKGYEVATASNGEDAIDTLAKAVPNIVFLDENMPGMSGLETLQEIKRLHPEVPVVMITKSEEEHIMEACTQPRYRDRTGAAELPPGVERYLLYDRHGQHDRGVAGHRTHAQ